jgi:TonB family protein
MSLALPRTRSFRRARPMRLWWLAVGLALLVNLGVVVGLSQVSRLHAAAPEPPLAVRTLHRLDRPPPPRSEPVPEPRQLQAAVAPRLALPSLDLPTLGATSELSLPALSSGSSSLDALLPMSMPAFAAVGLPVEPGLEAITPDVDSPAERIGAFDLDRYYPRSAKLRGLTGNSRVRSAIGADGRVTSVTVVESTPSGVFEQAAERLALGLRYRPATRGGQPVASLQDTIIAWTLK